VGGVAESLQEIDWFLLWREFTTMRRALLRAVMTVVALSISACANMQGHEPVQVTVAAIEPLQGEGLEMRMMVKLRVQNPNDTPIEYNGVYVKLDVQDKTFATGVSDERGSIPRFGESVISVPVTVSTLSMAANALGMLEGKPIDKINYKLDGKLGGPAFGSTKFQAQGEFALPGATP
jgi:LEA14-like dessication related protein